MGLTVSKPEGGDFEPAPSGTHMARCYMVVDLGIQPTKYGDKHKIRIGWELSNEKMAAGRPFAVSQEYTASLHADSNLTKVLTSWRGRAFTEEELAGFDLFKIAGAPCMVTVIHNIEGERTFANIGSVTSVPKGLAIPEMINEKIIFSLEQPDNAAFQKIPERIRKKINYGSSQGQQALHGNPYVPSSAPMPQTGQPPAQGTPSGDFDDDLPW